ncbi:MAG TPA: hypothetical protein VNQ90_09130 [Chthoniobacteraceae bacterium]|nr:hypothetical protein [Chthoniobacteraceae bacterium]
MSPPSLQKPARSRSGHGWSLPELCVVLVLVAILLGLLVPAYQTLQETSRRNQCGVNIRTLTQAILHYSTENNGAVLPWHFNEAAEGDSRRGTTWATYLQKNGYLPNLKASENAKGSCFACPARSGNDLLSNPRKDTIHYGYNAYPGFDSSYNPLWSNFRPYRLAGIKRPAQTICIGEMNGSYRLYPNTSNDRIYPHRGGMQVSYFDGHIEWLAGPLPVVPRTATLHTEPWW